MRLFGKKREEDPEEEENGRTRTFPKKDLPAKEKSFKDLIKKPREKKKTKGEIEIWNRKQRFFVVVVFALTVGGSALIYASAREWKLPNLPRLTLPQILSEETLVIEGTGTKSLAGEVEKDFYDLTNKLSGVYGFFMIRLSDGSFAGTYEDEVFEAASLNKLPVMVAMYREAERGNVNLSTQYVLKDSDKIAGSGSLAGMPAGTKITYEELVRHMGKESDNTAFHIARSILGDDVILATMDDFGLPANLLLANEVTPKEIAYFFKTLLSAKKVSRETRDAILEDLTDTIYEDWIARDLDVDVAHKFGTLVHVRNDAGVVMSDEPYILVVMSKGIVESEADEVIPAFSEKIYFVFNSAK